MSSNFKKTSAEIKELIYTEKLFSILRGIKTDQIVEVTKALLRGGIKLVEVTFDQSSSQGIEETLNSITCIKNELGDDICLGAGTVLTCEQVQLAEKAGAQFIVSPNVNIDVIKETKLLDMVSLPGALTPTEIEGAYAAGADMIKVFPGGNFGPDYVKAIGGPFKGVPLIVVGGVTLENIDQFLRAGAIGVGLGSNLVDTKEANTGNFAAIEYKATAFVDKIQRFKG